ncbi:hypothetical protein [Yokenella regensburgei]|uniref:Phage tail protein n=1 Tax=Yokenella regensburgei TaxID=158877 RepID=A0AB38FSM0_9ENTR|nr:hypothetical protein [Yokenella regensburgei]RKR64969.1 hypothetical protein C7387_1683 [Yokenella regensburgei]SQA62302.1 Uncharacterised protein [Yokenella regensburgei]SQA68145.1 Uncharacterised protein [Yokenella regensburgei]SUQ06459.1 Uncharacterised protein [Yokenella regensburgei]VFS14507.1 Uncharacterised protein [Yokenella regensburgei]
MKKVIVFFNAEPSVVVSVAMDATTISRTYPGGETTSLQIMSAGFPSLTGDHRIIYVATDRELSAENIEEAAKKHY